MTEAENGKKWTLREELLAEILETISQVSGEEDFANELFGSLMGNSNLRNSIISDRNHKLIADRMILGYLPDKAKPAVNKFITELLKEAQMANC